MPSPAGNDPQLTESRSSGALASVLKSLTGSRNPKSTVPPSTPTSASQAFSTRLAEAFNSEAGSPQSVAYNGPSDYEGFYDQLKNGKTIGERTAGADALRASITDCPQNRIINVWYAVKDLIDPSRPIEARHAGYGLLTAIVKLPATDLERKEYFETITASIHAEDFHLQLVSIVELTSHGKDLGGFHYDLIPLLTSWLRSTFETFQTVRRAPRTASTKIAQSRGPYGEETNLFSLFDFIIDVIKFSFNISTESSATQLIEEVIYIAEHARLEAEIQSCVRVIDSIVTYGIIPGGKLQDCVKVLCSIYFAVQKVRDQAWRTISNLCSSHSGHTTVKVLLYILRDAHLDRPTSKTLREVRGVLAVLEAIMAEAGDNGYPRVPFNLLVEVLDELLVVENLKVEADVLKLLLTIFTERQDGLSEVVVDEDWAAVLELATRCSTRIPESSDGRVIVSSLHSISPTASPSSATTGEPSPASATSMAQTLYRLIVRIEELLRSAQPEEFSRRESCMTFFAGVYAHLPESCAKLVIEYYVSGRLCFPSDLKWKTNVRLILKGFFLDRARSSLLRLQALRAVTDVYEVYSIADHHDSSAFTNDIITTILSDMPEEVDVEVLQAIVTFAVSVAGKAGIAFFEHVVKQLHQALVNHRLQPNLETSSMNLTNTDQVFKTAAIATTTPSTVITRGLVQIFMRTMEQSPEKASRAFDEVLWIAKSNASDPEARILAMKMLFRLRSDWANRIFLTPFTESDSLAATLYRTAASLARKKAEEEAYMQTARKSRGDDTSGSRPIRSISSSHLQTLSTKLSRTTPHVGPGVRNPYAGKQLWTTPDTEALPEHVSGKASDSLVSHDEQDRTQEQGETRAAKVLNVKAWLDAVIVLLQQGCDWEIYSYVLVHLPSQLSNLALFRGAVPQIRELRKVLCEQMKNSGFHEPPDTSGLRKADVAGCLFHILTILISYHRHFTRHEEDEVVKSFVQGITTWEKAAKTCIHALAICCHELPASMRLALVNALQKMSQIVTQAHVAVHILEFLVCLSRLPELYSNFREEEYRFVFGICFRYLQNVREKGHDSRIAQIKQGNPSSRPVSSTHDATESSKDSSSSLIVGTPTVPDDLPQYVYALAYHVITFWFLSLRLSDRAGQVSWIIKNLVYTDESGRQQIDEQSQVTMDFMQRTAYANVDESRANPDFVSEKYGEIVKRRWVVGDSIITIEQAIRNDWAQITRRQPSATTHFMIHEQFEKPPPHQALSLAGDTRFSEENLVLPHYLLMQLGPSFATTGPIKPVLLPDDEMVTRAIASFDRISTLDGHKVGVIYVGERQTQEVEILSNVMGSSDYTEFLSGLGTLTKLQGATFNTQGLDRQFNTDGEYTFCWRDRVSEIVFHVTTLMPTDLEHDAQCIGKKRHIGNDFVNIIFNNSGLPFDFDTFPSDFNYVNIVITPESRASFVATRLRAETAPDSAFYKVQVMSKRGFPEISPAAEIKMVSLKSLPVFVRLLAINASVFSLVWANRKGGEHVSSWRSRLREIVRLHEKYGGRMPQNTHASPPGTSHASMNSAQDGRPRDSMISRRASVATFLSGNSEQKDERLSKNVSFEEAAALMGMGKDNLIEALDFSRWA